MGDLTQVVGDILQLLLGLGATLLATIQSVEATLREFLAANGVSPILQTLILIVAAFALIVVALRIFGGLLRILLVAVLVLIAIQLLMPALLQVPSY